MCSVIISFSFIVDQRINIVVAAVSLHEVDADAAIGILVRDAERLAAVLGILVELDGGLLFEEDGADFLHTGT